VEDSFIVGKKLHLTKKLGGSEAGKPWTLKVGGGLEPRSLTEVYAYACDTFGQGRIDIRKQAELESGPIPNVTAALSNIGVAICSTPQFG